MEPSVKSPKRQAANLVTLESVSSNSTFGLSSFVSRQRFSFTTIKPSSLERPVGEVRKDFRACWKNVTRSTSDKCPKAH